MKKLSIIPKSFGKAASTVIVTLFLCIYFFTTALTPAFAADSSNTYKFADISLEVSLPDDLVGLTRNVTSNNSYLDRIGTNDVEELRSLMITNNIYLEAIPKNDNINYEILINGKKADSSAKDFNELSTDELNSLFNDYVAACDNIENSSVKEKVTDSKIYSNSTTSYFELDVTSVANNMVTTYVKKYYTVMMGKSITFTLQSNGTKISDDVAAKLLSIVDSSQYKTIKKSIWDNQFVSEIATNIITVLIPILILAVIVFFVRKSTTKTKKQIAADEERYREKYAREKEQKERTDNNKM